ncbi:AraC family transcriptional regulator [Cohnella sp. GCM10020058]|uniref:AraC family transcriptional regulator n=1 Tax=Cohnella sp. GCM10020058 TaxID=3317330 RepID=UPI00362FD39E
MSNDQQLRAVPLYVGMAHHKRRSRQPVQQLDTYVIRLQTSGTCEALIDGAFNKIVPGDLLVFKPGDPYELILSDNSIDYYAICSGSWMDWWWQRFRPPQKTAVPLDDDLLNLWSRLERETLRSGNAPGELTDYLLRAFCLSLQRLYETAGTEKAPTPAYVAYSIKRFIDLHAAEALTLEQIARHAGVSVSRTVSLFKRCFNQSIMSYAIEVRLATACERIRHTSMSLDAVAASCGFNSYTYFHRQFRMRYGLSPRRYREEQQKRASFPT